MKTLLLLRHAKSSWDNDSLADFDRPLNDRGRNDAPRMGKLLAQLDLIPDLIVSSSAKRAAATAKRVAAAAAYEGTIRYTREFYLADPETYLELARQVDDEVSRLMLVGHNPGIEELVSHLAGGDERMPTAALACFHLAIDRWQAFDEETEVKVVGVWRPREIGV